MMALRPVCAGRVAAGMGNMTAVAYTGLVDGSHWVYMDITEGAYGGRPGRDGVDAVDVLYANTRNNPIEDIEAHYPLRVTRYELRTDRGGAGRWRGGVGSIRETQLLSEARVSLEGDGHRHPPRGAFGGSDGTAGEAVLVTAAGREVRLPSKLQSLLGRPGDTIRTVSPCGGGYGDPRERSPERVLDDVLDGIVSRESAHRLYGVAVESPGTSAVPS